MTQEIIEQNKLIAEFLGYEKNDQHWRAFPDNSAYKINDRWYPNWNLQYHSSWDWLMSAVEKIRVTNHKGEYCSVQIGMTDSESNICTIRATLKTIQVFDNNLMDATYKAVIGFIQWYNEIKNKQS